MASAVISALASAPLNQQLKSSVLIWSQEPDQIPTKSSQNNNKETLPLALNVWPHIGWAPEHRFECCPKDAYLQQTCPPINKQEVDLEWHLDKDGPHLNAAWDWPGSRCFNAFLLALLCKPSLLLKRSRLIVFWTGGVGTSWFFDGLPCLTKWWSTSSWAQSSEESQLICTPVKYEF